MPRPIPALMALAAPAAVCGDPMTDNRLAGLAQVKLPKHEEAPRWATEVSHRHGKNGLDINGGYYYNQNVETWLKAADAHDFPHPQARGWRLVRTAPTQEQYWCVRRLKFDTTDSSGAKHKELTPQADGSCRVEAFGKHMLKSDYAPGNAFEDSATDGCTLKDPSTGLWYLGIVCDHLQRVDQVKILQMDSSSAAAEVKLQQLHSGAWMDVGLTMDPPVNYFKTVFQAAVCSANVCDEDHEMEDYPRVCKAATCTMRECCQKKTPKYYLVDDSQFQDGGLTLGYSKSMSLADSAPDSVKGAEWGSHVKGIVVQNGKKDWLKVGKELYLPMTLAQGGKDVPVLQESKHQQHHHELFSLYPSSMLAGPEGLRQSGLAVGLAGLCVVGLGALLAKARARRGVERVPLAESDVVVE